MTNNPDWIVQLDPESEKPVTEPATPAVEPPRTVTFDAVNQSSQETLPFHGLNSFFDVEANRLEVEETTAPHPITGVNTKVMVFRIYNDAQPAPLIVVLDGPNSLRLAQTLTAYFS